MSEAKAAAAQRPLDDYMKGLLKPGVLTQRMLDIYVKPDHDRGDLIKFITGVLTELKGYNDTAVREYEKRTDTKAIQPYRIRNRAYKHLSSLLSDQTVSEDDRYKAYRNEVGKLGIVFTQTMYGDDLTARPDIYKLLYLDDLELLLTADLETIRHNIPILSKEFKDVISPTVLYILGQAVDQTDVKKAQKFIKDTYDLIKNGPPKFT
jgi:hypothetical protein